MATDLYFKHLTKGNLRLAFPGAQGLLPAADVAAMLVALARCHAIHRSLQDSPKLQKVLTSRHFFYLHTLDRKEFQEDFGIVSIRYGSEFQIVIQVATAVGGFGSLLFGLIKLGEKLAEHGAVDDNYLERVLTPMVDLLYTHLDRETKANVIRLLKSIVREFRRPRLGDRTIIMLSDRENVSANARRLIDHAKREKWHE